MDNENASNLSVFIKEERDKRGLSQREFGEWVGISLPTVSMIENGAVVGRQVLQRVAKALQVDFLTVRNLNRNQKQRSE